VNTGVCGYVLAGGLSSRMGSDKAEMQLGGLTLLEIAVGKLRQICGEVVVVGRREFVPAGVRVIPDLRPGCGPMGGIEAALSDAGSGRAMFLPVDMPLVPADLLGRMAREWIGSDARVCLAVVDGRVQPLVSLVGSEMLRAVRGALARGEYKVSPVLEGAGAEDASQVEGRSVVRTEISTAERDLIWPGWRPSEEEWAARELWFANLNTPEEFASAQSYAGLLRKV